MDADGARLASRRLPEGLAGVSGFHEVVAAHVAEPSQLVIGIETDRGLWVQALSAAGYQVYAVNPLAVARYRDRHQVSGAKSDAGDAGDISKHGALGRNGPSGSPTGSTWRSGRGSGAC
jgi:transposase